MTEQQRSMLLDLISEWSGIIHESAAAARMAQIKADIDETWFAWSGPTAAAPGKNIAAYYRIQGPHLVIEYAPQGTLAATQRCTCIPCIAIRRTTMAGGLRRNESAVHMRRRRFFCHWAEQLLRTGWMNICRQRHHAVEQDRVDASMRLIPGVAVSSAGDCE